ncbi:MAG: hypothetical protein LBF93_01205 [Zoogloeaceae bacterium]|jgi:hypothetical protein|nr:hypothetical protein [Zoogloeaceae bacterium]
MRRIFSLFFISLFFLAGKARADLPELTLGYTDVIWRAPDGRLVTRVDYSEFMGFGHTRYLWVFTLEDTPQYPKRIIFSGDDGVLLGDASHFPAWSCALPETCESHEPLPFAPDLFYWRFAWDSTLSGYFSPDGKTLTLFETRYEWSAGETTTTTHVLSWDDLSKSYALVQIFTLSAEDKYLLALEGALETRDARLVLRALSDMGGLGGQIATFERPPERVILPLWRFFSSHETRLAEFMEISAAFGWRDDEEGLEVFLRYSASIKGVAGYMAASIPLLEKQDAAKEAEAIRKALSGSL